VSSPGSPAASVAVVMTAWAPSTRRPWRQRVAQTACPPTRAAAYGPLRPRRPRPGRPICCPAAGQPAGWSRPRPGNTPARRTPPRRDAVPAWSARRRPGSRRARPRPAGRRRRARPR
jgi:hypothetical protein